MTLLSDEFVNQYKNKKAPFGGNGLGELVYLRTYARWLPELNRREDWYETVRRVVEYSCSLDTEFIDRIEAEELFDNIFNLKVFPAGRTLWIGGTDAAKKYPMANFNCSFRVIDSYEAFTDIFYLLMLGCGTGFRVLPDDIIQLPHLAKYVELSFISEPVFVDKDKTFLTYKSSDDIIITVGDSKEGWVDALHYYFALHQGSLEKLNINLSNIRPKGSILKTFGGRASGPEGLIEMFTNIHKVINSIPNFDKNGKAILRPIDALDILNNIAYNVVSGGVRRSSQIGLFDIADKNIMNAKVGIYTNDGNKNYGKNWRAMSNNSIYFNDKPSKDTLLEIFKNIEYNGEPGFLNSKAASKRRPNFNGINPCAEILLDNRGVCNLTEINLTAFIIGDEDGYNDNFNIDWVALEKAIFHATRMGIRMTLLDLELLEWDKIQKRDRLVGVSLTGVEDCFDKLEADELDKNEILLNIWGYAHYCTQHYTNLLKINQPLLVTTVKPSGTISQLPTVSSGVHRSFAPFYIRRIRVTSTDPLAKTIQSLNYPVFPETGQGPNRDEFLKLGMQEQADILDKADTWVVEFPVKTDAKISANSEKAVDQLQRYLDMQDLYTDHNTSITITFSHDEIDKLVDMILENWDDYVAVSFLAKDMTYYNLIPYEQITEAEYNQRIKLIATNWNIKELLNIWDNEVLDDNLDPSCVNGVCPVR